MTLFIVHIIGFYFLCLGVLKIGWNKDRQIENTAAQKDLEYIDILTALLKQTEKRKVKVGSVVTRLIGELQQLKYYLEGMANPATPSKMRFADNIISFISYSASITNDITESTESDRPKCVQRTRTIVSEVTFVTIRSFEIKTKIAFRFTR